MLGPPHRGPKAPVRAGLGWVSTMGRMISREPTLERLAVAQSLLLEPFGLTESLLKKALGEILSYGEIGRAHV